MKTTKRKVAKRQPQVTAFPPTAPAAPDPSPGVELWSNSPVELDESLRRMPDGRYFFRTKDGDEPLVSPAHVAEFILQRCIPKEHWHEFAAHMPTLYPDGKAAGSNGPRPFSVTFSPGASALLTVGAAKQGETLEEFVMAAAASHALCIVCDSQPDEEPELAALFGIGEEAP